MSDGFWQKTRAALTQTRRSLSSGLATLFSKKMKMDEETFEALEALLIGADMGVEVTQRLMSGLKEAIDRREISNLSELNDHLKKTLIDLLNKCPSSSSQEQECHQPLVTLFVGVNGVGKTTTIGKRAAQLSGKGRKVLLAAADTFRAGAAGQLAIWGARSGSEVIGAHQSGADPSAVVFDAISAGLARKADHLLIDTAGRLQTQHNLMAELKKMVRVIQKQIPGAPHETILVLDATTGQNALSQAKHFQAAIGLTEIILTKLDGTGRGGIVIPIAESLSIPVTYVGVGEGVDDLIPFNTETFVAALFETDSKKKIEG